MFNTRTDFVIVTEHYDQIIMKCFHTVRYAVKVDSYQRRRQSSRVETQKSNSRENYLSPVAENRGFAPLVRAFVVALNGEADNPILPMTSMLSHHLIALI
jgi:hypothetical protein